MRDKNRIPKILKELEQVWKENPDLRLGQIITIATRPKSPCPDIFSIEDEDVLIGIQSIRNKVVNSEVNKRKPYWEIYPEIIKMKSEEITTELINQFIEAVRKEKPDHILTPRSMMKLIGAPVDDLNWLSKHKDRIEKLNFILKIIEDNGEIEIAEIGYKIK